MIRTHSINVIAWLLVAACLLVTTQPASAQPRPMAIIKCKFSDQPQEPFFDPALITGAEGLAGYWATMSGKRISLDGTELFPPNNGWYNLPITLADAGPMKRKDIIKACVDVVPNLDLSRFSGVIAIINAKRDSGSESGRILLDPYAWFVSFAAHEMGHIFGLDHSFDEDPKSHDAGGDSRPGAYGNGWDIMSAMNFGGLNPTYEGTFGASGPGLIAPYIEKLGWLPAVNVLSWTGDEKTFSLAPVTLPQGNAYSMAKVFFDAGDPQHYYTVELRLKKGWDRGIPNDTVLIHEIRPDGLAYLVARDGGPERLAGSTFRDATNNVAISVLDIDPASGLAVVSIGRNEVWVDFRYSGVEAGTFTNPYRSLKTAVTKVAMRGTIRLKAGVTAEAISVGRGMTLEAYGGPVTLGSSAGAN